MSSANCSTFCSNNVIGSLPSSMHPIFLSSPLSLASYPSSKSFNGVSLFKSRAIPVNSSFRIKCSATSGLSATPSPGFGSLQTKAKHLDFDFRASCNFIPRATGQGYGLQDIQSSFKWQQTVNDAEDEEALRDQVSHTNEIRKWIYAVKLMLSSLDDGEINVSAYDTAWVALIKDIDGRDAPQFPSSLEWIANNQLPDGSWGDSELFLAHDRILNTLACVIALRSWNVHPLKSEKGIKFLTENLSKLGDENAEHMPIGFEVAFPSLLEIARSLNIEVPEDSPVLKEIFASRNLKLKKIPKEVMHKVPTTLLFSLEGMPNLDWNRLLKLQFKEGSFLFSPSSTAFAVINTKDKKSLAYLNKTVQRFNGGVPNVYPVDLFERIWIVDRIQRLGISRYFQQEIKGCLSYVRRYWDEKGICWARNSEVQDVDDTAMAFRLLRLHGHEVSADVLKNFKKNGEFFCVDGQSTQAVTGMFNLYRASQVLYPGEEVLEDAKQFSAKFLTQKRAANDLYDKWIITKDLPGEVGYALDVPWYASLPRLESRFYIEQYGGKDDVWIGKTLYRMGYVNNDLYLNLAKLDYNNCQDLHHKEWITVQRWYSQSRLQEFGLSIDTLVVAYYLAAASIFEPEKSLERCAWAKTIALMETITSNISDEESRKAFADKFNNYIMGKDNTNCWMLEENKIEEELLRALFRTLDHLALEVFLSRGQEIALELHQAWQSWLSSWQNEENRSHREAELLVQMINITAGHWTEELQLNAHYQKLVQVTNKVCHQLCNLQSNEAQMINGSILRSKDNMIGLEIESAMQELVQLVFQYQSNKGINLEIKNSFLHVARSFYYAAYFDRQTIKSHIDKVLSQKVV